jgi:hypothetical protein
MHVCCRLNIGEENKGEKENVEYNTSAVPPE